MTISTEAQAKGYRLVWDEQDGSTTGVCDILRDMDTASTLEKNPLEIYTLQGTRVYGDGLRLPKGVYIINKRKVVVR